MAEAKDIGGLEYPKDYKENLAWRRSILMRANLDPKFREKVKELFFRDILFAFNAFFFTLDVRRRPDHQQPFCTYPFQDESILSIKDSIDNGEDVVLEKSRDMGASWMIILIFLWFWLNPKGGTDFLLGSRIEDYVDKKGDMRALLPKARYAFYRLPKWLWPKGFQTKVHDNFMRFQNPQTGASITGESNNANYATGGRYAAVLFDEFAKWEGTDKSAWTSAGDATPCRIPISTSFGASGKYYELATDPTKKKIRLHWSLHPRKAEGLYCNWPMRKEDQELGFETPEDYERVLRSPWYDQECSRREPEEIAQELDIDYLGSGNPVFGGKAGRRIGILLKLKREPLGYMDFDLGGLKLNPVSLADVRDSEGFLTLFEKLNPEHTYALGVDVVEGVEGGDYAIVKILDRITKSVSATYYSRINEVELARVVKCVGDFFTTFEPPWIGIETTGPGLSTFDFCYELYDIQNLFMMPVFDTALNTVSHKKGWRTTQSSRNVLIAGIKDWLLDKRGWADSRLCRECITFVHDANGKAKAKAGSNDDEVIAFGIALQVDMLAPLTLFEPKEKKDENVISVMHFPLKATEDEPKTIEERCFATAQKIIEEKKAYGQFDYERSLNEQTEEYGWDSF